MALLTIHYYAKSIQMASVLQVVLPEQALYSPDRPLPVVLLLSPEGAEGAWWLRHCRLEHLSERRNVAFVLVPCLQGCHCDMAYGYRFAQVVEQDIPAWLDRNLPLLSTKGQWWIAGCSMGGTGALRTALLHPERYAGTASFWGRLSHRENVEHPLPGDYLTPRRLHQLYGTDPAALTGTDMDLLALLNRAADSAPTLHLCTGQGQPGYASNLQFVRRAQALGYPCTLVEAAALPEDALEAQLSTFLNKICPGEEASSCP